MEPSLKQIQHRTSNSVEERVVCLKILNESILISNTQGFQRAGDKYSVL